MISSLIGDILCLDCNVFALLGCLFSDVMECKFSLTCFALRYYEHFEYCEPLPATQLGNKSDFGTVRLCITFLREVVKGADL